jgi:hypothetical protein
MDGGLRILEVADNHYLLYGAFDLPTPTGQPMERTTLVLLEKRVDGNARLIIRTRGYAYGSLGKLWVTLFEVLDYLNTQAQLKNIKERVEMVAQVVKPLTA